MLKYPSFFTGLCLVAILEIQGVTVWAQDAQTPKAIPQTRPEMKAALEKLKSREARLPLPPLSSEEQAAAAGSSSLGVVNNGRMRSLYLPPELRSLGGSSRQKDPKMSLEQTLAVELFWIASRVNNCHYCLGHQEVKLKAAGVEEETLAALDCDWKRFTPRERAAFALASRLTASPHDLNDVEFKEVEKYFSPTEVLEIVYYVARYNATNRWTDSLGIPQEDHRELDTVTPAEFLKKPSVVALQSLPDRGPLPDQNTTMEWVRQSTRRKPRVDLLSVEETKDLLANMPLVDRPANWMRALCHFSITGVAAVETYVKSQSVGDVSPLIKAQIAWISARNDRAPYALGHAAHRLAALGYDADQMFALERGENLPARERVVLAFTAKLTAQPQAITDQDVANLRAHFSDSSTAEIVHLVTQAAFFDRLTEGMQVPLETSPW